MRRCAPAKCDTSRPSREQLGGRVLRGSLGRRMTTASLSEIARAFLIEMQACVRAVDFERARPLFAEDVIAFGTFAAVVVGRDGLQRGQLRNIWPATGVFTLRLAQLHFPGTLAAPVVRRPADSTGH